MENNRRRILVQPFLANFPKRHHQKMSTLHDLLMNTMVPHGHNLCRWIIFEALQKLKHDMFADIAGGAKDPEVLDILIVRTNILNL